MPEVVELIRELGSPDLARRKEAIRNIGDIGSKDPDGIVVAISPLVANLEHENVEVRVQTIESLSSIADAKVSLVKGMEPTLRKCLQDGEKTVRIRVIDLLSKLSADGFSDFKSALPLLKHYLIDPNPEIFNRASAILKRVGSGETELIEILDPIDEARGIMTAHQGGGADFKPVESTIKKALTHLVDLDYQSARREAMESLKTLMAMDLGPAPQSPPEPEPAQPERAEPPTEAESPAQPDNDDGETEGGGEVADGESGGKSDDPSSPKGFVPKAEELLELARVAYESGDFAEVERLTQQIESLATKTAKEYYDDEVLKKINNAEEFINDAQKIGADVSKSESLLTNAREAMNNGYFEAAINYVNQTLAAVKEAKKQVETKKSTKKKMVVLEDGLNINFTFESFIVGNNSRFVYAASQAVAKKPAETYNPLFIYGGAGLGKTHLLNAIGNEAKKIDPNARIKCVTSERVTADLIESIKNGQIDEFQEVYRSVDILLIDDIHFLAGKESTQEEFFNTFNALYNNNKQIVITSDRPPSSLQNLADRIVSRLEGGLIADIQPPNLETKIAILEAQARSDGITIPSDVISYIANRVKTNIRSLKGALKKAVAYANVTDSPLTLSVVDEAFKSSSIDDKEAGSSDKEKASKAKEEKTEEPEPKKEAISLEEGFSYLVKEERPKLCFDLFQQYFKDTERGLCITRSNPKIILKRFDLGEAKVLWLTDTSVNEPKIYPKLESMMYVLEEFIEVKERGVLLLDGVEYLISIHGFSPTLKFLREIIDDISMSSTILLLPLNPAAIDRQEASMLEREMEAVTN